MRQRIEGLGSAGRGVLVVALVVAGYVLVFQKHALLGIFDRGETVRANFVSKPQIDEGITEVKVADVVVGTVRDVRSLDNGQFQLEMRVDRDVIDKLGRRPTAQLRVATVLGGKSFVDIEPSKDSGAPGDAAIPASRTKGAVELNDVLRAFQGDARQGLQTATKQLDTALAGDTQPALRRLLEAMPPAARPAEKVFGAAQGTRPQQDLPELVIGAQALAEELSAREGRVANIVDDLHLTTQAFGSRSDDLRESVHDLPRTLENTRTGLKSTREILDQLRSTAREARPAVEEAEPLVDELDSTLDELRPLAHDLKPLLDDAVPVLDDAVPLVRDANVTLKNIDSPVIDRIRGPVTDAVVTRWESSGAFEGNGNENPLYKELGYLAARGNLQSLYGSKNGTHLALELGVGFSTLGGNDLGFTAVFQQLFGIVPIPPALAEQFTLPSVLNPAAASANVTAQAGPSESRSDPDAGAGANPVEDAVDAVGDSGGVVDQIKGLLGKFGGQ